MNYLMQWYCKR